MVLRGVWYGGDMGIDWLKGFRVREAAQQRGDDGLHEDGKKGYMKDFDGWNIRKKKIAKRQRTPWFREREVWWCSVGTNIGCEIDGKGKRFCRPVLVFLWISKNGFIGIPLTGKIKNIPGWHQHDDGCLVFEQIRFYDARRLTNKKHVVRKDVFEKIIEAFTRYITSNR